MQHERQSQKLGRVGEKTKMGWAKKRFEEKKACTKRCTSKEVRVWGEEGKSIL